MKLRCILPVVQPGGVLVIALLVSNLIAGGLPRTRDDYLAALDAQPPDRADAPLLEPFIAELAPDGRHDYRFSSGGRAGILPLSDGPRVHIITHSHHDEEERVYVIVPSFLRYVRRDDIGDHAIAIFEDGTTIETDHHWCGGFSSPPLDRPEIDRATFIAWFEDPGGYTTRYRRAQ